MPVRAPEPDPMEALAARVLAMRPEDLERWAGTLDPVDLEVIERILADHAAMGWRAHPAAMAAHLDASFKRWAYVDYLSQRFRAAVMGQSKRQIWSLPARYGKSSLAQWGTTWALDLRPEARFIFSSYGKTLATENAVAVRDALRDHSDDLRTQLRLDRRRMDRFVTEEGGGVVAAGITGAIRGFGAGNGGGVIVDDPFKDWQEAHSENRRNLVWNQYRGTLIDRLDDEAAFILVIHHRVHTDDLTGRLIEAAREGGEQWEHVVIPALAVEGDVLGRAPGEALVPERFSVAFITEQMTAMGSYLAAALIQQDPSPEEGTDLLRAWFDLAESMPARADASCSSWDLKLKDKEAGDFVVGQAWWRTGPDYWLMDQLRGQWDHATTANAIALMAVRRPEIRTHVIEAAGSADTVVPELRKAKTGYEVTDEMQGALGMSAPEREAVQALRRRGMGGLVPSGVVGDKRVRARTYIAPYAEAGNVHLPSHATFVPHLLDECVTLDTVIFTSRGMVAAEDVQVGDMVLTHRGRFRPVLAVRRRSASQTVEVRAKALDPLIVTPEHPVLSMRLANTVGGCVATGIEWVPASEMRPRSARLTNRGQVEVMATASDALTFPRLDEDHELTEIDLRAWYDMPDEPAPGTRSVTVTDDGESLTLNIGKAAPLRYGQPLDYRFGRVCGLWLAEGSYSNGRAQWSFHANETDFIDEVRWFLADRFGSPSSTFTAKRNPHCTVVSSSQRRLERFFMSFGHRAPGKRVPEWAWAAPVSFHRGLIDGWLDGDGHDGRGTTTSPHLAWGVRLLATRLGVWPKMTRTEPRGMLGRHATYTVDMRAKSRVSEVWADDDGDRLLGFWVRSIDERGPAEVVNFHVEDDESYVTTGGAVHNCAAFPMGTHDDQVDAMSQALKRLTRSPASVTASTGRRPEPRAGQGPTTVRPVRATVTSLSAIQRRPRLGR